jgi:hypothetical protein
MKKSTIFLIANVPLTLILFRVLGLIGLNVTSGHPTKYMSVKLLILLYFFITIGIARILLSVFKIYSLRLFLWAIAESFIIYLLFFGYAFV